MEGACVTWIFVGMLVFRIGGGSGGWASVPLWCILLLARVVGFTQLTEFIVLIKKRFNIKFILYLRVYTFDKLFSPDRFSQLVYGRTYLLVETRFRTRDGIMRCSSLFSGPIPCHCPFITANTSPTLRCIRAPNVRHLHS